MQRWTALLLLGLLAAVAALVVVKGGPRPVRAPSALADAGVDDGGDASVATKRDASAEPVDGGERSDTPEPVSEGPTRADAGGALLLNGEPAPPVAGDAPKSVVFGAILITYRGAQQAPPNPRSREAALALAKELAVEAKTDFKAAVAKGDKGSLENAGRMPRGVLEPAPEFVLFGLGKGDVGGPIDTPKGYWIVQRIE